MIAILGGGFGIYGHLPALVAMGFRVSTLRRYRSSLEVRPFLATLISRVSLIEDEDELIARARIVVLARRPRDNMRTIRYITGRRRDIRIVVEKPLAADSCTARQLHRSLIKEGIRYHVPYLFLHCQWTRTIRRAMTGDARSIRIDWDMEVRNSWSSWKYDPEEGGGIVAYYAINFLALVAHMLGPTAIIKHIDLVEEHSLSFVAANSDIEMLCRFGLYDRPCYRVEVDGHEVFRAATPFGHSPAATRPDPRIGMLTSFYRQHVFAERWSACGHVQIARLWSILEGRGPSDLGTAIKSRS